VATADGFTWRPTWPRSWRRTASSSWAFDAKAYLASFTSGQATLGRQDEPSDYRALVEYAGRGSTHKPILIGVSEGAGLSVLAATDPVTKAAIGGVIGLGLPDKNELGWRWKDA
jgi:hypothetical protein